MEPKRDVVKSVDDLIRILKPLSGKEICFVDEVLYDHVEIVELQNNMVMLMGTNNSWPTTSGTPSKDRMEKMNIL